MLFYCRHPNNTGIYFTAAFLLFYLTCAAGFTHRFLEQLMTKAYIAVGFRHICGSPIMRVPFSPLNQTMCLPCCNSQSISPQDCWKCMKRCSVSVHLSCSRRIKFNYENPEEMHKSNTQQKQTLYLTMTKSGKTQSEDVPFNLADWFLNCHEFDWNCYIASIVNIYRMVQWVKYITEVLVE